ncbi:hypothetical protein [Acinetobacter baumannii]|uniref:Uncharacterized protein n=1 Tax=Acinetobacter baumannii TaxID=470 RepID=A0AAP1QWW8_ACIBA|nr:hypothetical protein [Acinetobacter baumannii]MBD2849434.1 hypothetical protein [Acinetobacter baumannii]MBD3133591.1 hypothetical protein [Acinetobacter baumannii]MBE0306845.1 hypothetical protein [Acinetobacter baumannii]MBE0312474.1 hypothetical protein [Acinetobacter baumannii]MBE0330029.1 hypothetical protein [Acinetobacter baumannii]
MFLKLNNNVYVRAEDIVVIKKNKDREWIAVVNQGTGQISYHLNDDENVDFLIHIINNALIKGPRKIMKGDRGSKVKKALSEKTAPP